MKKSHANELRTEINKEFLKLPYQDYRAKVLSGMLVVVLINDRRAYPNMVLRSINNVLEKHKEPYTFHIARDFHNQNSVPFILTIF